MKNISMQKYMVEGWSTKGYTLIELIVSLSVTSLLLLLLLSTLQFSNRVSESIKQSDGVGREVRNIHLFFQKQILKSEKIYIKDDRVYLQDTDHSNSSFYNYYDLNKESGVLYRYKVYEQNLSSIGLGGTSQIGDQIEKFSMVVVDNMVCLKIKFRLQTEVLSMDTWYPNEVIYAK